MVDRYRPKVELLVDWDGDGTYANANADVFGDLYGYDIKFGIEAAIGQQTINFVSARGEIELWNREGRYSAEGPNAFDAAAQRKRQAVKLRVDAQDAWTGLVEPLQPVQVAEDVPRALGRLRGRHYDALVSQRNYLSQSGLGDRELLRDAVEVFWGATTTAAVKQDRVQWHFGPPTPLYYRGVRPATFAGYQSGSVDFDGSLRQFLSRYGRWAAGPTWEDNAGDIGFISWNRRNFRIGGGPQANPTRSWPPLALNFQAADLEAAYEVNYPLLANYPRVDGVRNRLNAESFALTVTASETLFVETFDLLAGQFSTRLLTVEETGIIAVTTWSSTNVQSPPADGNDYLGPSVSASKYTAAGGQKTVLVSVRNNSARSVTVTVTVTGTPLRIVQGATVVAEDADSQASYGIRDMTEDMPPWFLAPGSSRPTLSDFGGQALSGQDQADAIIDRLASPIRLVRMSIPGWQSSKVLTDALYGRNIGDRVRIGVPTEDAGVPNINEEMLLAAIRYVGRLNQKPRVEWDLISFPWSG